MTFGKVHGNMAYFIPFWYFVPRKIWQPWSGHLRLSVCESGYVESAELIRN
jgi:hypothetical protein